ncbi:MAG TPA: elongation factor G [Anaerolineae bacterium]|nr:elongation factor G [Anaerolineae bacterium]HQK12970.1 elongation factor G [Anaerolineae bacterium]
MKEYTTQKIRNIALIGHGGSGKTTWTEAVLFLSKATNRRGKVEDGTTVMDYDDEEIRRKISLNLGVAAVEWNGYKLNIMDTPGYTDFVGEVRSALRVADTAVIFVDASAGVEVGTELTWGYADEEKLPKVVLINKMDRENANFDKALKSLSETFNAQFLPMLLPIGAQADFKGVINVLEKKAYMGPKSEPAAVPAAMAAQVDELYTRIVEAAVEADEALMEKYFADEPLTPEEISTGLRKVIVEGSYVPVLATAGGSDLIGLSALVDLLVQIVPSPDDRPFTAQGPAGEEELAVSDLSPFALLVFKTTADPYVGKLTYFRVYGGMANSGDTVYNSRAATEERLGQIFVMRGKEQIPVERLHAGDIGGAAKMSEALTGDTLCSKDHVLTMRGPLFPHPLYTVAVSPKTKADTAKMGPTLTRICEEDPTLHWYQDQTTRETLLAGMGDAHVEAAVRRMQTRFGVALDTSVPKVPYKETITATNTAQYRHKKQTGGAGQFAEVHMRIEPLARDAGFQYEWEVFGGRISSSFKPSIEKGIKSVMSQGVIAGYPIVDVLVAITDGKEHPVDSKDIAFQIAGREGFKQAFQGAKPVLLEPIYNFVITVPEEFAGAVMSDLNTRRARVQGMEQSGKKAIITASAPLAEMLQYATNLRAITQGRGVYSMELSHYDVVPAHLTQQIIEQAKIEHEED